MTAKSNKKAAFKAEKGALKPGKAGSLGRTALFAGSFDPITLGHLDLIERAARIFTKIMIGVGEAAGKEPLFSVGERVKAAAAVCSHIPNVEVSPFSGLAVDHAIKQGATVLVRGLRSGTDYFYEMQMAQMNHILQPTVETVFLPTAPQFAHVSSSLAKEIARHSGSLSSLVPPIVSRQLAEKIKGSF